MTRPVAARALRSVGFGSDGELDAVGIATATQ